MKTKKSLEIRATYRARTTRTLGAKPRVAHLRVRKPSVPVIDWERRQYASWQELEQWRLWLNDHSFEFERKFTGKYLAVWNKAIIAVGKTWGEAFDNAAQAQPNVGPLITYIPTAEEAIFVV